MSAGQQFPGGFPNPDAYQPFSAPLDAPPLKPAGGSGLWKWLLVGCLGFFLLLVLLCAGVSYYAYQNAGQMMAGVVRSVLVEMVNQSELSPEDKQQVIAQVDRVVDGYKQGKITLQDLEKVGKEMEKSALPTMFMAYAAEAKYLDPSGLSAEEKQAAEQTLLRLCRGLADDKIEKAQSDALFESITETGPGGERVLKERLTDDELRKLLARAKELADQAEIPAELPPVDIGDEVQRIIDRALGDKLTPR